MKSLIEKPGFSLNSRTERVPPVPAIDNVGLAHVSTETTTIVQKLTLIDDTSRPRSSSTIALANPFFTKCVSPRIVQIKAARAGFWTLYCVDNFCCFRSQNPDYHSGGHPRPPLQRTVGIRTH